MNENLRLLVIQSFPTTPCLMHLQNNLDTHIRKLKICFTFVHVHVQATSKFRNTMHAEYFQYKRRRKTYLKIIMTLLQNCLLKRKAQ
jgi:hypothetical protein